MRVCKKIRVGVVPALLFYVCEFVFAGFMLLPIMTAYVAQEVGIFFYIDVCIFKIGDEGEFEDI